MRRIPRPIAAPGLIQTGDVLNRLVGMFGIKGKTPAPILGDEVHPVAVVADLSTLAFNSSSSPNNERRAGASGSKALNAGSRSVVALFNPVGSGVVARVDAFGFDVPGGGGSIEVNFENSDPASVTVGSFFLDRRNSGNPVISGLEEFNGSPSSRLILRNGTVGSFTYDDAQIILNEGRGVSISTSLVNTTLAAAWFWWTEAPKT
jgi:hypothetical protein